MLSINHMNETHLICVWVYQLNYSPSTSHWLYWEKHTFREKKGNLINVLSPLTTGMFHVLTFRCCLMHLMIAPKFWFISCCTKSLVKSHAALLNISGSSPNLDVLKPASILQSDHLTLCHICQRQDFLTLLARFYVAHLQSAINCYRWFLPSKRKWRHKEKDVHLLCSLKSHQHIVGFNPFRSI